MPDGERITPKRRENLVLNGGRITQNMTENGAKIIQKRIKRGAPGGEKIIQAIILIMYVSVGSLIWSLG